MKLHVNFLWCQMIPLFREFLNIEKRNFYFEPCFDKPIETSNHDSDHWILDLIFKWFIIRSIDRVERILQNARQFRKFKMKNWNRLDSCGIIVSSNNPPFARVEVNSRDKGKELRNGRNRWRIKRKFFPKARASFFLSSLRDIFGRLCALHPLIRKKSSRRGSPLMVVPRCHGYLHASNKRWLRGSRLLLPLLGG